MNKQYFNYLYKSKKTLSYFTFAVYILGTLICQIQSKYPSEQFVDSIIFIGLLSIGLCFILPPIFLNYIHSKRGCDSYLSLPVQRKEIIITTEIYMMLIIMVPAFLSSLVTVLSSRFIGGYDFNIMIMVRFALIAMITIIVVTAFNSVTFLIGNSTFDGIVMEVSYSVIPFVLLLVVNGFVEMCVYGYSMNVDSVANTSILYTSISLLINRLEMSYSMNPTSELLSPLVWIISVIVYSVITVYGLNKHFVKRKSERAESISDQVFAYPFNIYFYSTSLLLIISFGNYSHNIVNAILTEILPLFFAVFICFIIANFVYKRKISISFKNVGYFLMIMIISLSLVSVAFATKGFSLAEKYEKDPRNVYVSYNAYATNYVNYHEINEGLEFIEDILKENEYDNWEYLSLSFEALINDNDIKNANDLLDEIDKARKESINHYYFKDNELLTYYGYLNIVNNFSDSNHPYNNCTSVYGYCDFGKSFITKDNYEMLEKYGTLSVEIITDDGERYNFNGISKIVPANQE